MKNEKSALKLLLLVLAIGGLTANASAVENRFDEAKASIAFSSAVNIRANIYYGDEDETIIPIFGNSFYLFDQSAALILRNAGFEFEAAEEQPADDESYLQAAARSFLPNDREDAAIVSLFVAAEFRKHQTARIVTDKLGRGETRKITPGKYYLFGIKQIDDEIFVWNLPVEIKPGINSIKIDQYNAATDFQAND